LETMTLTTNKVIAFLKDTLQVDGDIDVESELFSSGTLDSVAMLQLITFVEEEARDIGHTRFGIAIGRRRIPIDIAEIALPVDERIARGEILREPDQRLVDRLVAMRMERAHHVADDLRAFLERRAGIEPENLHAVEDAPMDRLQPVAGIGKGPAGDRRKGIGKVTFFERIAKIDEFGSP